MMEERNNELDKIDDVMLPGYRFHPTDEELVDFYLKRKIQHKTLPIELIKQVDIYKYDPWDLPKLASTGEKEWYFYCPRDRKYRNSVRPNRVTRAGFWKATGTDRPICSSEGKCIGLKKSLVFYRGRAAKGMKTDWMMHEFRLPCLSDSSGPPKKFSDKTIPASEAWAICRIFKKTTSISMAQKALSQPWFSQLPGTMVSDILTQGSANFINNNNHQYSSENNNNISSCTTPIAAASTIIHQISNNANTNFSASSEIIPSYNKPIINSNNSIITTTVSNKSSSSSSSQIPTVSNAVVLDLVADDNNSSFNNMFYTLDSTTGHTNPLDDCIGFGDPNQQHYNINTTGFSITLPQDNMQMQATTNMGTTTTTNVGGLFVEEQGWRKNLNSVQLSGFPFNLSPNNDDFLKPATFPWELSHPACPSDMSITYATSKCYI